MNSLEEWLEKIEEIAYEKGLVNARKKGFYEDWQAKIFAEGFKKGFVESYMEEIKKSIHGWIKKGHSVQHIAELLNLSEEGVRFLQTENY